MEKIVFIVTGILFAIAAYSAVIYKFGAVLQQCGYKTGEYFGCFSSALKIELFKTVPVFAALAAAAASAANLKAAVQIPLCAAFYSAAIAAVCFKRKTRIKPRLTKRFLRINIAAISVYIALGAAAYFCFGKNYKLVYAYFAAFSILLPLILAVGVLLNLPTDRVEYAFFVRRAKKTLENRKDLIKIAVTGSCGKTTVKNYLAAMLSVRYKVLATPASYNTPLGICLALKDLTENHRVFIAEMGARKKGDIAELCKIVKPDMTIITGITPQHLQTFKTMENIIEEKSAAVRALGENGVAIISGDTKGSLEIYVKAACDKVLAGINKNAYFGAENISLSTVGAQFTLRYGKKRRQIKTDLLGKHNVTDFVLAAAAAVELGVSVDKICSIAHTLTPPEHRFKSYTTSGGFTVIDDGYNANIEGLKSASGVLSLYRGIKVAVVSGIAEGGKNSVSLNMEAGRIFGKTADTLIAVGPYAEYIASGAASGTCFVITVKTLDEAKEELKKINLKGGVVLFANDMPDKY